MIDNLSIEVYTFPMDDITSSRWDIVTEVH